MENEDPFVRFLRKDPDHAAAEKAQPVLASIERLFGAVRPHQRARVLGASLPELKKFEARPSDAQSLGEVWS